jgi:hypothetical protein
LSEKIKKTIRPVSTTVVLSCLVWMYADQITTEPTVELVPLQVTSQSVSQFTVELQEPASGQLQVTFSGPRADLEMLKRDLGTGKFKPVYSVKETEVKEENLVKDAAEIINAYLRKDYPTISVQETKPAQIKIFVDQMVTVTMPIRVTSGITKTTTPVITPREVKVTLSKASLDTLNPTERFIVVDIENELRNKVEDRAIDEDFAIPQAILGQSIVTTPTRVRINLRIQRQFLTKTFDLSRIEVMGPAELLAKYRVDIRDPQITVALKGPTEQINNLNPKNILAFIILEPEDIRPGGAFFPRQVQFKFPEGFEGIKPDEKTARRPEVDFKLVELQAATPTAKQ